MKSITLTSRIPAMNFHNKRVLLRVDLNVPFDDQDNIIDDHRLKSIIPTITAIHDRGGSIILATHRGRPEGADQRYSTRALLPWFVMQGYTIIHMPTIELAHDYTFTDHRTLLLLENLRFFAGEQNHPNSPYNQAYDQALANLADIFVLDAFGLLHRTDASITRVPLLFTPACRTIGFLIEHEFTQLNKMLIKPSHPFILIIGGKKIASKIPLITALLDYVDTVMICPALVFTVLKAEGREIGASLIDQQSIDACRTLLAQAAQKKVTLLMPQDFLVAQDDRYGKLSILDSSEIKEFKDNQIGIAIGPETASAWGRLILEAKTIVFNGAMGFIDQIDTLDTLKTIYQAMQKTAGHTIIAGGDSVAMAHRLGIHKNIDYFSAGGGATIAYLSNQPLPGLTAFLP